MTFLLSASKISWHSTLQLKSDPDTVVTYFVAHEGFETGCPGDNMCWRLIVAGSGFHGADLMMPML